MELGRHERALACMESPTCPLQLLPVVRRYRLAAELPAPPGAVLPREVLEAWHGSEALAQRMLDAARAAAQAEQAAVREEAAALLASAREQAAGLAQETEQAVWRQADQLLAALRGQQAALRTEGGRMLAQLAREGLRRVLLDLPSGWAAESSVRQVLREWRGTRAAGQALLRLHPQDLAELPQALRAGPRWECVADSALAPGACVLSAGDVGISADYRGSVNSLVAALGQHDGDFSKEQK